MRNVLLLVVPFVLGLVGCGERPQISEQQLADNMLAAIHVTTAAQKVVAKKSAAMAADSGTAVPCKE